MSIGKPRRVSNLAGALCAISALLSIVLSLGLPGLGWITALIVLILTGLLTSRIGKLYSAVVLSITVTHLLTLGPLSLLGQNGTSRPSLSFLAIFVIVPFLVAIILALVTHQTGKGSRDP